MLSRWPWGLALAALAALMVISPGALGAGATSTVYVDGSNPSCSDTGQGTATQPFCGIRAAASKAIAGTTVEVAAGTYAEQVSIANSGTSDAPITFTAAPGASVIVTGNGNGFSMSNKNWITINGFFINGTANYGISVFGGSNVTISNNRVTGAGTPVSGSTRSGIRLSGTTDSLVAGNTSDHNSDHGILITTGAARNRVTHNVVFNNAREYIRAATGIRLYQSPDGVVDHNVMHDNEDSGVEAYAGSNNTLFYNNVAYNNGDHGIDNNACTGQRIIANSVYKNVTAGINVEGGSTGATLANNISVDNGINSPRTHSNIRVEAGSTAGTTMDYDLAHLTVADSLLIWNSVTYYSLASFQAATGQESHGVQADPRWADAAGGDFRLTAGSPAIDSANAGVSGQPSNDIDGNPRVDDPATPDTGAGPRSYDDRGAYEFQPPVDAPPLAVLSISGKGPLAVTGDASGSTDTDSTPIASYTFDFGDGAVVGPQPGATASHTYATGGTYTVMVTVADTAGLSSSATATVVVAPGDSAPAAALIASPNSGAAPLSMTADASGSTDTDGTPIATYTFDFGDGTTPVGPQAAATAAHTYTAPGIFTVQVTVTDTAGLSSTATATVQVGLADNPPVAALTVTPTSGLVNLAVTANASASTDTDSTPIASYTFDFGDGTAAVGPQAGAIATHTYTRAGTFTVRVTVSDSAGLSSTAIATVIVTDAAPVASLSVSPGAGRAPHAVSVNASASTDTDGTPIASYKFDFGDGSAVVGPQSGATTTHTYTTPGNFTVTVTVTDTAGNSATATKTVKVKS